MSNVKISALPTAATIDATADYLPIVTASLNTTQKISRNILLGITGSPLGTSDSQVITNKTIGVTNTVTVSDTLFTIADNVDATKLAQFQLSGITTGTTRTYTLPNASSTLADIATTQTFTNKTLTSPTITGGTIDNTSITVDAISGHTSSTIVTVANLQISNGVLNTNNSVVNANIADAAVTPAKLLAGTGTGWAYQSWTPTWTNLTVGNGTVVAHYIQTGKTITFWLTFTLGSTSAVGSNPIFSLPVSASASYPAPAFSALQIGEGLLLRNGVNDYQAWCSLASLTTSAIATFNVSSTYPFTAAVNATTPGTWAATDIFALKGTYEAA